MKKKPDALKSLYGKGHVNATRTRECVAMPGVREQRVLTPQNIVDALNVFWSEGIAYDAAGVPESLVGAEESTETRGLLDPWPHRTYCNPPYGKSLRDPEKDGEAWAEEQRLRETQRQHVAFCKAEGSKPDPLRWPPGLPLSKQPGQPVCDLRDWLVQQIAYSMGESVLLAPNRSQRPWLRWWKRSCVAVIELNSVTFEGFAQPYPMGLVLGLHTGNSTASRRVLDFIKAFKHLGDPSK